MKWIFLLLALVLVLGCISGKAMPKEELSGEITENELGPDDYTEADALDDGTIGSEEELGSGLDEENIF